MVVRKSREATAFTEFMSARSAILFRTAYLIVGDHQLAQDLLQESLIKTYISRGHGFGTSVAPRRTRARRS